MKATISIHIASYHKLSWFIINILQSSANLKLAHFSIHTHKCMHIRMHAHKHIYMLQLAAHPHDALHSSSYIYMYFMLRLTPAMRLDNCIQHWPYMFINTVRYQCSYSKKVITIFVFLSSDPLSVPSLTVSSGTNSAVKYDVHGNDDITNPLITGYEVIRFGVPMIGEYVNAGRGRRVTISPAVPGAQYRITAWALNDNGSRSATPAVGYVTTGEASECGKHKNVLKYQLKPNG